MDLPHVKTASSLYVVPIPAFNDNYIWCIYDPGSQRAIVVDPGDAAPVIAFIQAHALQLAAILVTHHHADHTGGVTALAARYHCPVYASASEYSQFRDYDHPCRDGDSIQLLDTHFEVIEVPGHTLDHIAFYSNACSLHPEPWLFCGDTLFSGGCGRIFNGSAALLYQSICRINTLPETTLIFCTHEYTLDNLRFAARFLPDSAAVRHYTDTCQQQRARTLPTLPSSLKQERLINPFLRLRENALLEQLNAPANSDDEAVFTLLRAARDQFNATLKSEKVLPHAD